MSFFQNLSKRTKIIMNSIIIGIMSLTLILGIGLSIPGEGMESLKFINSLKTQIQRVFPKGKYVIDYSQMSQEEGDITASLIKIPGAIPANARDTLWATTKHAINIAYSNDAVSSVNFADADAAEQKTALLQFANEWFQNKWGDLFDDPEHKSSLDLYDVGMDLIDFDKAVATEFHSYGYVNPGISWMFKKNGINEIFGNQIKKDNANQEKILDQTEYDNGISPVLDYIDINKDDTDTNNDSTKIGLVVNSVKAADADVDADLTNVVQTRDSLRVVQGVDNSLGTNIVNNKVWFLNSQIDNLRTIMEVSMLQPSDIALLGAGLRNVLTADPEALSPFTNDALTTADVAPYTTVDDLYHPQFSAALPVLKAGVILFLMSFPLIAAGTPIVVMSLLKRK